MFSHLSARSGPRQKPCKICGVSPNQRAPSPPFPSVPLTYVLAQLSLYSYSRTVTRRINDMVTMQAHLLLITSVYDREVYNNQDKQTFFDSNFVSEMREAIELMDAQAFQDLMTGSPEMEKERTCLKKDITAHEMVMHLLRQGGIGTI